MTELLSRELSRAVTLLALSKNKLSHAFNEQSKTYLPYCIQKHDDKWIVLNRHYKPIGQSRSAADLSPEAMMDYCITLEEINHEQAHSFAGGNIYLYDDACPPRYVKKWITQYERRFLAFFGDDYSDNVLCYAEAMENLNLIVGIDGVDSKTISNIVGDRLAYINKERRWYIKIGGEWLKVRQFHAVDFIQNELRSALGFEYTPRKGTLELLKVRIGVNDSTELERNV